MAGRTAVVTGASSGIGAVLARRLATLGSPVIAVGRSIATNPVAAGTAAPIEAMVADLRDPHDRARVSDRLGGDDVGILVNCAGVAAWGRLDRIDAGLRADIVATNVAALADLTSAATTAFVPRGRGLIVNVSSTAGYKPMPNLALYGASKAFVTGLSQGLDAELRGTGVRVATVVPGPVRTPMLAAALGFELSPPGRLGRFVERSYVRSADETVDRIIAGLRLGRTTIVTDRVDRSLMHLPRPWIARLDRLSLRLLRGDRHPVE